MARRASDLSDAGWTGLSRDAINNRHLLDLGRLESVNDLSSTAHDRILEANEPWEQSDLRPEQAGRVGYSTVVRNVHGPHADDRYYLFYATHDPPSGIGLAVSERLEGPFRKWASAGGDRADSRVLIAPPRPAQTSHFSSPVVLWNEATNRWHLYFHFYANHFAEGHGHQHTALATSDDLVHWEILRGSDGGYVSVLPTTRERWMNSQSSYHAIQRMPNGLWLAFVRGTGGQMVEAADGRPRFEQDTTRLAFAVSEDGIRWALVPGAPQLVPGQAPVVRDGVLRPLFLGRLRDRLLCAWQESNSYDREPRVALGTTSDLQTIERVSRPFAHLTAADGAATPWQAENGLWLFSGASLHRIAFHPA